MKIEGLSGPEKIRRSSALRHGAGYAVHAYTELRRVATFYGDTARGALETATQAKRDLNEPELVEMRAGMIESQQQRLERTERELGSANSLCRELEHAVEQLSRLLTEERSMSATARVRGERP